MHSDEAEKSFGQQKRKWRWAKINWPVDNFICSKYQHVTYRATKQCFLLRKFFNIDKIYISIKKKLEMYCHAFWNHSMLRVRCTCIALTCIMHHQLLDGIKLCPCCDVITTIVQLPNFIVLDMIPLRIIPVSDRQRVRS